MDNKMDLLNVYGYADTLSNSDNLLQDLDEIFGNPCENALSTIDDIDNISNSNDDSLEHLIDSDYFSNSETVTNDLSPSPSSLSSNSVEDVPVLTYPRIIASNMNRRKRENSPSDMKNVDFISDEHERCQPISYQAPLNTDQVKKQKLSSTPPSKFPTSEIKSEPVPLLTHLNGSSNPNSKVMESPPYKLVIPTTVVANSSPFVNTNGSFGNSNSNDKNIKVLYRLINSKSTINDAENTRLSKNKSDSSVASVQGTSSYKILVPKSNTENNISNVKAITNEVLMNSQKRQQQQQQPQTQQIRIVTINPVIPLTSFDGNLKSNKTNTINGCDINGKRNVTIHFNTYKSSQQNCNSPPEVVKSPKKPFVLPKLLSKDEKISNNNNMIYSPVLTMNNNNNNYNDNDVKMNSSIDLFNNFHDHNNSFEMDERALKKKQRMIKNRESAKMSRIKRNQYLLRLQTKVNELSNENILLKNENEELKDQLSYFSENCQCTFIKKSQKQKHKIIETENGGTNLNMRKNTAVLLAMVIMVSLNIGSFHRFFIPMTGRNLQDTGEFGKDVERLAELKNEKLSDNDNGGNEIPDVNNFRRHLLWFNETYQNVLDKTDQLYSANSSTVKSTNCPTLYLNQTENMRLVTELRKWIEVNEYVNITSYDTDILSFIGPKSEDALKYNNNRSNDENISGRGRKSFNNLNKKRKGNIKSTSSEEAPDINMLKDDQNMRYMHVFNSVDDDHQYLKLFKKIHRKDDTFYVLSFNNDHILLPASAYNKTSRPKIALMFPATNEHLFNSNNDGKMILMQIDCEIMNTTMLEFHNKNGNNVTKNKENHTRNTNRRTKLNLSKSSTGGGGGYRQNYTKSNSLEKSDSSASSSSSSSSTSQHHYYENKSTTFSDFIQNHNYNENSNNNGKLQTVDDFLKKPSPSGKSMFKLPPFYVKKFLV